jgi:hypothetical protein
MHAITATEFPFVKELPKRTKTKMQLLWDQLARVRELEKEHGRLLPMAFAAALIGVTKQRVDQLCDSGLILRVDLHGHPYVAEDSLVAWMKLERKSGRPVKEHFTLREAVKLSREMADRIAV